LCCQMGKTPKPFNHHRPIKRFQKRKKGGSKEGQFRPDKKKTPLGKACPERCLRGKQGWKKSPYQSNHPKKGNMAKKSLAEKNGN